MQPAQNPYDIIGLPQNASGKQIRKAYRRLAMKLHPDRNPGNPEAEEKFKAILRAYETLMAERSANLHSTPQPGKRQSSRDVEAGKAFFNFFEAVRARYERKKEDQNRS